MGMRSISPSDATRWFALVFMVLSTSNGVAAERDLAESVIAKVAAATAPGEFSRIETTLPSGVVKLSELFRVRVDDGRMLSIDGWTDSAHWDPVRKRTYCIGMRKYKKFISYDTVENRWRELGWQGAAPPKVEKFGHTYGRTALDWKRGH